MNVSGVKFRFQEELALQTGLAQIAQTVLKYSIEVANAKCGVFLYQSPGATYFEVLSTEGYTPDEIRTWSHCPIDSIHPLVHSIQSGKSFFGVDKTSKKNLATLPIGEVDFCFLGFMIELPNEKALTDEGREFLLFAAARARSVIDQLAGEGV